MTNLISELNFSSKKITQIELFELLDQLLVNFLEDLKFHFLNENVQNLNFPTKSGAPNYKFRQGFVPKVQNFYLEFRLKIQMQFFILKKITVV